MLSPFAHLVDTYYAASAMPVPLFGIVAQGLPGGFPAPRAELVN
jgi:hypothetical protein